MDSSETLPAVVPAAEVVVSLPNAGIPSRDVPLEGIPDTGVSIDAIAPAPIAPTGEKQPPAPRAPQIVKEFTIGADAAKALAKILGVVKRAQARHRMHAMPQFAAFQIVQLKDRIRLEAWAGPEIWIGASLPDDLGLLVLKDKLVPTEITYDLLQASKSREVRGALRHYKKPDLDELVLGGLTMSLTASAADLPATPQDLDDIDDAMLLVCETKSLAPVLVATSTDDTRANLQTVMFELCEHAVVATDGHRLHKMGVTEIGVRHHADFLVDRPFLDIVEAAGGGGRKAQHRLFAFHEKEVCCRVGDFTLRTKVSVSEFPNWRRVIPKSVKHWVEVPRQQLLDALAGAMVVTTDRIRGIRLKRLDDGLEVHCEDEDRHVFNQVIPCSGWEVGAAIGLNCRYLIEALMPLGRDVAVLGITDDVSPISIEESSDDLPSFQAVVMPMRL